MRVGRRQFCHIVSASSATVFLLGGYDAVFAAQAVDSPDSDGLPRARPEAKGVDPASILAFLDDVVIAGLELHSFMLACGGAVVAEGWWWPYAARRQHMMHSLTKSVTSCGVGLAIDEGRFALSDKVVSFFPDELPAQVDNRLATMTVRDLLTMRTGHAIEVSGSVWRQISTSWVKEFFKIPVVYTPGTHFQYTSAASFMLSAIISKTTGQSLCDYLEPRLFRPLGMCNVHWDIGPQGINPGGNGLSWTTADSLKLGMLHVQNGVWNGQQILPRAWVHSATTTQVPGEAYGYQWRRGPEDAFYGSGQFTQLAIGFPSANATIAITAAIADRDYLLPIVWKHFPAAFGRRMKREQCRLAQLNARLDGARLLPLARATTSPLVATISGRSFSVEPNIDKVEALSFRFEKDACVFTLRDYRGEHTVNVGIGRWIEGDTSMTGNKLHHQYQPDRMRVIAAGSWLDEHSFEMTWQFVETAFRDRVLCRFDDGRLTLDRSVNVNSADTSMATLYASLS